MIGKVASYLIDNGNKLGVDIDEVRSESSLRVLMAYFNAKYMFPDNEIRIYRSSGREGYHVVIYGVKSTLKLREMLGDCEQRRDYSEYRSMLRGQVTGDEVVDDVMFDFKYMVTKDGVRVRKREEVPEWNFLRRW